MSLSTHVLDAVTGQPAVGMTVRLERRDNHNSTQLAERLTGTDGRITDLADELSTGSYRLTFDTGSYFDGRTFYPEVAITFTITDPSEHYHVPLLLSPYAFSTYRGS